MQPVQRPQLAWRWLGLTGVVLLLHLWLLGSLPLPVRTKATPTATYVQFFATRTLYSPAEGHSPKAISAPQEERPSQPKLQPKMALASATQPQQFERTPPPPAAPDALQSTLEQATLTTPTSPPSSSTAAEPPPTFAPAANAPTEPATKVKHVGAVDLALVASRPLKPTRADASPPSDTPSFAFKSAALSASTRLIYQVKASRFPYRLSGELLWRNEGDRYQALLRYSALGLTRSQTSHGRITDQGLAPERFSDKYRSEVAAHFNYARSVVTFSANTPDAPLLSGAQDRLSVLIQLGALVASNRKQIGPGSTLSIQTVGARAADIWLFSVAGTDALALPGGNVDGIKLERLPRELYDQKVEVWLAPQLGYLPARIRITEANGDSIDQLWQATETVPADASLPEPGVPASDH